MPATLHPNAFPAATFPPPQAPPLPARSICPHAASHAATSAARLCPNDPSSDTPPCRHACAYQCALPSSPPSHMYSHGKAPPRSRGLGCSRGLSQGKDWVPADELMQEHAGDAHHGGAPVVALRVELPGLAEEELVLANVLDGAVSEVDLRRGDQP